MELNVATRETTTMKIANYGRSENVGQESFTEMLQITMPLVLFVCPTNIRLFYYGDVSRMSAVGTFTECAKCMKMGCKF